MNQLDAYDYDLPDDLIAQSPASPRDAARLFVYDTRTDTVSLDIFRNIGAYLPSQALLVLNDTKVVPARLWLTKETGGKIEVLLMMNEIRPDDSEVKGIVDRKIEVGAKLFFTSGVFLDTIRQEEQFFFFRPSVPLAEIPALLLKEGTTPIPPYIKNSPLSETALRERYQSIFAAHGASVAAPTASLHFTPELLTSLAQHGMRETHVTLNVGMGTFAPISEENFTAKKLFTEYYAISDKSKDELMQAKERNISIIPVGTTACRTIESAFRTGTDIAQKGPTDIFIFPPYDFTMTDGLITNFHVPRSSLMLLVDALLENKKAKRRTLDLYKIAIKEKFRFYSFGDAMLIV